MSACQAGAVSATPTPIPTVDIVGGAPSDTASARPSVAVVPSATATALAGTRFRSDRYGYGLTVPDDWNVTEVPGTGGLHPNEPGVDTFQGDDGRILSVIGQTLTPGASLETWSCAIGQHLVRDHKTPVESTELLMVAGKTARLTRYHLHIDPYVIHYLNVEVIDGGEGLTLSMESTGHDDMADDVILHSILETLTLP